MYKLAKKENSDEIIAIRIINGQSIVSIPIDLANVDYQKYLEWLSQGNQPEPANE
jgi:hypothetical protein